MISQCCEESLTETVNKFPRESPASDGAQCITDKNFTSLSEYRDTAQFVIKTINS